MSKKNKSRIPRLVRNVLLWVVYGVVVAISCSLSQSISVNGFIPTEVARQILKSLVEVNIALLGFWGLILVFSLNYLRETKGRVGRERYELEIARDRLVLERSIQCANGVKRIVAEGFANIEKRYRKRANELRNEFQQVATEIGFVIIGAFVVVVLLLAGLLQSITAIGRIGSNGLHFMELVSCLAFILMAVFLIFYSLWVSRPKYEREIVSEQIGKAWAKFKEGRKKKPTKSRKE